MFLSLVLLALAVIIPARADPVDPRVPTTDSFVFHGCAPSPNVENWTVRSHWTVMINSFQSWETCQAFMANLPSRPDYVVYVWWFPGEPDHPPTFCGLSANPPDTTYPAADLNGNCPVGYSTVGVQKDVTVTNYKFSYQFAGCYADMIQSDPPAYVNGFFNGGVNATHVAGMQRQAMMTKYECLTGCATEWARIIANFDLFTPDLYGYAIFYAPGAPETTQRGGLNCLCAIDTIHGRPSVCENYSSGGTSGGGSPTNGGGGPDGGAPSRRDAAGVGPALRKRDAPFSMAYVYPATFPQLLAEPSAAPARRRAARAKQLALQQAKEHAFCPAGLTPCHVSTRSNGYECLDVTNELESCGGCRWGVYGNATSAAVGFDCTRRRGVDSAATSCVRGKCTVSACRAGFKLARGECIKV